MCFAYRHSTFLCAAVQVMICGGFDGFSEESSYEFAQMKATSNSDVEFGMGRDPKDMCRPTATTRAGFMEAQGAGIQILMTAELALRIGCPIFGIVALTNTATDKVGRSVPAPGQGILTTARETKSGGSSGAAFSAPVLDVNYRQRNLELALSHIESWRKAEMEIIQTEATAVLREQGEDARDDFLRQRTEFMQSELSRLRGDAQSRWGMDFYKGCPGISPLRGALAVWGLDVDDITVSTCMRAVAHARSSRCACLYWFVCLFVVHA